MSMMVYFFAEKLWEYAESNTLCSYDSCATYIENSALICDGV